MLNAAERLSSPETQKLLDQCIHCGLCLPACPTYALARTEMEGPRGRIALIRAASQGEIGLGGAFQTHLELCLGCRACETACPSGVQYGALFEIARENIEANRRPSLLERFGRWISLRQLLPHRRRLRGLARLLRLAQRVSLPQRALNLSFLPGRWRAMADLLPLLSLDFPDYGRPAPALARQRGTVAFFPGCVQDAFLAGVNAATIRVLQRNGYEVHFPLQSGCCGAAALHLGEGELARHLARQNIEVVDPAQYEAIINNAGGCGATLKDYSHLLQDDPAYAEKAQRFSAKVQDISEFLAGRLHEPPSGRIEARVVYADSCHLRHGQRVISQPRRLLQQIPGLTLVELRQPDRCCGSAGVYNILHPETSEPILAAKTADIQETAAQIVVTTNPGCQMQLLYGLKKAGLKTEVVHLVELLDRAYL
jgi:glycolate oxidase iron-sulfur subunit